MVNKGLSMMVQRIALWASVVALAGGDASSRGSVGGIHRNGLGFGMLIFRVDDRGCEALRREGDADHGELVANGIPRSRRDSVQARSGGKISAGCGPNPPTGNLLLNRLRGGGQLRGGDDSFAGPGGGVDVEIAAAPDENSKAAGVVKGRGAGKKKQISAGRKRKAVERKGVCGAKPSDKHDDQSSLTDAVTMEIANSTGAGLPRISAALPGLDEDSKEGDGGKDAGGSTFEGSKGEGSKEVDGSKMGEGITMDDVSKTADGSKEGEGSAMGDVSHQLGGSCMDTDSDGKLRALKDGSTSHAEESGQTKSYRHPTKNPKRDLIRDKIAEALKPHEQMGDNYSGLTAAIAIEHSMHRYYGKDEDNEGYNDKTRSILFNIRDPRNPDFRRRVLSGQIQPERLAMMDSVEMASDSLKKQREIYDALITQANTVGRGEDKHATTDMFFCRKCEQRKCTYYQMQTRSADEPMTTFVTCLNCGNRWKD